MRISARWVFLAVFLACAGLMGYGYYLQHWQNLEPCPLCILQRYAFIAVGVVALVAAVHGPGRVGQVVYALLVALAAGAGTGIAARQTWLQHNPPTVLDCGPDLAYMLGSFPLAQALPKIFKGEGDCAKVTWTFLGLSIAEWALVWFVLFVLAGLYLLIVRRPAAG
jgi:protein dithiol:quinone oxidoreductase